MSEARLAQARAWMRQDPDAETRDELAAVITRAAGGDEAAVADLDDRSLLMAAPSLQSRRPGRHHGNHHGNHTNEERDSRYF